MALVFRSYLGLSSRWANAGEATRTMDYQVWCGPAMGAFNEWTRGSYLEQPQQRSVVVVAHNLLVGAARQLQQQTERMLASPQAIQSQGRVAVQSGVVQSSASSSALQRMPSPGRMPEGGPLSPEQLHAALNQV